MARKSLLRVPRHALGTQSMLFTNEYVDAWTQGGNAQSGSNTGGGANAKHLTLAAAISREKGEPSPESRIVVRTAVPAARLWPTIAMLFRGDSWESRTTWSLAASTTCLALSRIPECALPPRKGSLVQTTSLRASAAVDVPRIQSTISPVSGSAATKKLGQRGESELCKYLMSSADKLPMYSDMFFLSSKYEALANLAYRAAFLITFTSPNLNWEVIGCVYRLSCSTCFRIMPKLTRTGLFMLFPPEIVLSTMPSSSDTFCKASAVPWPKFSSKCDFARSA
mmetsp:Transcript_139942/g.390135  ORF Transcript_139942/g.390135 Transcript_139942/m.390135 type:complete len:281 (+) Transcript_139942:427-1269(+)